VLISLSAACLGGPELEFRLGLLSGGVVPCQEGSVEVMGLWLVCWFRGCLLLVGLDMTSSGAIDRWGNGSGGGDVYEDQQWREVGYDYGD